MRASAWRLLALCGFAAALYTVSTATTVFAESLPHAESQACRPWIMVGLSPKGCTQGCRQVFSAIRDLSGNRNGKMVPFWEVTPEYVSRFRPAFIVLSPQSTPWCRYSGRIAVELQNFLWNLHAFVEEMNVPVLGICGGHQALALAFGGKVGPIRAGAHDCLPYTRSGQGGLVPLTIATPDPIFRGIHGTVQVAQSHYDEVKVLPPGFILLASERHSRIQIMRHPTKPVYGIQGHPEKFRRGLPDGGILLRNFVKIARTYNAAVRQNPRKLAARVTSRR